MYRDCEQSKFYKDYLRRIKVLNTYEEYFFVQALFYVLHKTSGSKN